MKEKPVQRTDFSFQNSEFVELTACLISFGNRSIYYVFWRNEQHTRHRFAVDFEAILRETAREVYSILDQAAPVWSPNGGRRFHAKEPERCGKAVGD